ncbi:hypothetical protein DY245_16275 [Streptomyces inhibens]|uniref:Secreted protein n=1 Tax=Streptomyces inhibens TaxID=2293571 RepID=A0A371Q4N2_STRIH|nr:hypothetical protein [Streptomyces inhibens]REK89323.1 hypothetical protein DY245_16275 [Streptomyces inhibens]
MNRRRRLSLLLTALLTVPLLATTACSHASTPKDAAPPAGNSPSVAPDQLAQMQKKVDDAEHAADSADANGNADNSGN